MLLKIGIRGNEVKDLQEYLGIHADGIFGKGTEESVKKWQSDNGLDSDGIVGPATWDAMGLATTDNSETVFTTESGLVINRHHLPVGEYKEGPTNKEYVFIHHTAGWNNPYKCIDSWGRDSRGAVATEFVLGGQSVKGNDNKYDGEVVQSFPEGSYGWHLGKNGSQHMHTHSVAIEVCNFGYVKDGKTYAGTRVADDQIVTLSQPFRGYKDWNRYSDKQIESLHKWILWISERDCIDVRKGLPDLIRKVGVSAFEFQDDAYYGRVKGLWTHTNTRKDKSDMFPQQELIDMLLSL
jgi:hypothetical protein